VPGRASRRIESHPLPLPRGDRTARNLRTSVENRTTESRVATPARVSSKEVERPEATSRPSRRRCRDASPLGVLLKQTRASVMLPRTVPLLVSARILANSRILRQHIDERDQREMHSREDVPSHSNERFPCTDHLAILPLSLQPLPLLIAV